MTSLGHIAFAAALGLTIAASASGSSPVAQNAPAPGSAASVAAGSMHNCVVTVGGSVWCWGDNAFHQLGLGADYADRPTPAPVAGLPAGVVGVSGGHKHTCAVTTTGQAFCWGDGEMGQLGVPSSTLASRAQLVAALGSDIAGVTTGLAHSCAATRIGAVKCWGANRFGQLGDGTSINRQEPVAVKGLLAGVANVSAGHSHTCALTMSGGVLCWGDNTFGQLGDGTTVGRFTPTPVVGLHSRVVALAAGGSHTCALTAEEQLFCWGENGWGSVGDGTDQHRTEPTRLTSLDGLVSSVATGDTQTCVVTKTGGVWCWGTNQYARPGDGLMYLQRLPAPVTGWAGHARAVAVDPPTRVPSPPTTA